MTGLETAIRSALERAGASDAATRERVYRSARAALEKGLAQRPDLDPEAADAQRQRFEALVREIEEDEVRSREDADRTSGLASAPAPAAEIPVVEADRSERRAPSAEAPVIAISEGRLGASPGVAREMPAAETVVGEVKPERTRRGRKKEAREEKRARRERRKGRGSGLLSTLFLLVTLIVFGGIALWFLDVSGLLDESRQGGGGPASFSRRNAEGAGLMTSGGFVGDWIPVFRAGKDDPPSPGSAATVEPIKDEQGQAVRITSAGNGPEARVRISFPIDTLRRMAGNEWVIALNARAAGSEPTQIAIECAFGSLGDCGRRRIDVAVETTDIVFKVDFTKGTPPAEPGYLLVNSDISGQGKAIDLFAVGLHPAE